jgi:hypothetical protein
MEYARSVFDALSDRKPQELIGAIVVGMALAVAFSGLYRRWRRKVGDAQTLLCSLMLLANVASMTIAAGYLRYAGRDDQTPDGPFNGIVFDGGPPTPHRGPFGWPPWPPKEAFGGEVGPPPTAWHRVDPRAGQVAGPGRKPLEAVAPGL